MNWMKTLLAGAVLASANAAIPVSAQERPVLLRDSFPLGTGQGVLCQVQDRSLENPARQGMFDRSWVVVCRDSARPVGSVYSFADLATDPMPIVAGTRREAVQCDAAASATDIAGIERRNCQVAGTALGWSVFSARDGNRTYVAEGFAAYDSATLLALRSILTNRVVEGDIAVATTSVNDPVSFARIQAETLEPLQALAEGYRRNLGGEYAEAAAYFETLERRLANESGAAGDDNREINPGEFLVNRALQKSNLGDFAEAGLLFAQAAPLTAGDPLAARLQRNFEAIDLLNQGQWEAAVTRLDQALPMDTLEVDRNDRGIRITQPIAARLNNQNTGSSLLGFGNDVQLSPVERAAIIDAQANQLKGTAQRILGDLGTAETSLQSAYAEAIAVRDGRVTSITRLRAQILGELALIAEERGDFATAESYLVNGIALLRAQYPQRKAVSGAEARLGALYLRNGREEQALAIYREVIARAIGQRDAATGFANQLDPYFAALAPRVERDPQAAADFFRATQVLVRPGVAETQAILARELTARSDDASRLFRQSTDLAREIEQLRIRYQALANGEDSALSRQLRAELEPRIAELESEQLRTQATLSQYPEYRVVSQRALTLDDFRATLGPNEAYAKLAAVGSDLYMFYTDANSARAWRVPASERRLDEMVDTLRDSISLKLGGDVLTYPYELATARELFVDLFGPVAGDLAQVEHLVFEPDAAMLRLPVDILVTDDASVTRYQARLDADPDADEYNFTDVAWLGRTTRVSTAVSAQSFVDARGIAPSNARLEYLGMGRNAPLGSNPPAAILPQLADGGADCGWASAEWNNPIDDAELRSAREVIGADGSRLLVGEAFTDTALKQAAGLDEYRVLHFATHGLVTAPRPECPARPALLTSFGGEGSDGLLTFSEIFDLNLDADIVILSACDTAGGATIEATRSAGVGSGGGTALDGLVRAFVGAGSRTILASHWPVPDDYNATQRLIDGMFLRGRQAGVGKALRDSQVELMNDAETSHPFYWAGFAIIGDGERRLLEGVADGGATASAADVTGNTTLAAK